jgi:hypothetical protein
MSSELCLSIHGWWLLIQGTMRSSGVIILPPVADDLTAVLKTGEPVQIQHLCGQAYT